MKKIINSGLKILIFLFLYTVFLNISIFAQEIYWDNPEVITTVDSRFPRTISNENKSYLLWQEVDQKKQQIYLSMRNYVDLKDYVDNRRFAGPFSYSGDSVPELFTAAINKKGQIAIAVLDGDSSIKIFNSQDEGKTFSTVILKNDKNMIAPRIYATKDDGFRIFTSLGIDADFYIYTSESKNGEKWSEFEEFGGSNNMRLPFVPVLIPYENGDLVVFQAQHTNPKTQKFNYQLFMSLYSYETNNWSNPVLITDENSHFTKERKLFYEFENQRPYLYKADNKFYLSWERTELTNSSVWVGEITNKGIVQSSVDCVSDKGNASRGILFSYEKDLYVSWFDTRRGNESVYYAKRNGNMWEEKTIIADSNSNLYSYPLILRDPYDKSNQLMGFAYQQVTSRGRNNIVFVGPDKSVKAPQLVPVNFKTGKHSKNKNVTINVVLPEDKSGIRGYSYTWSTDDAEIPEEVVTKNIKETKLSLKADLDDGFYYLKVKVLDRAGNWSETAGLSYYLDTTPPKSPELKLDIFGNNNILASNNYQFSWFASEDEDTAYYLYSIDRISDVPRIMYESKRHPLKLSKNRLANEVEKLNTKYKAVENKYLNKTPGTSTKKLSTNRYYNSANGLYVLSVAAVDEVGNIGKPTIQMFILNKFEPSTYITNIEKRETQTFETILTVYGGGFTYDGTISQIIIDKDGVEPYDLILNADLNQFRVDSNTKIININIGNELDEGSYKIILNHTDRGYYTASQALNVLQRGTVKIEPDFIINSRYSTEFKHFTYKFSIYLFLIVFLGVLGFVIVVFATCNLNSSINFNISTNKDVKSLISGVYMSGKIAKKKREKSLRVVLIRFTYLLIFVIVLAVSTKSGLNNIQTEKETLSEALEDRSQVLLESLSANIRSFMPSENKTEIAALPSLKSAMSEVKYVTILGQKSGSNNNSELDYIWATDDPDISEKIEDDSVNYGYSKIKDDDVNRIVPLMKELETEIVKEVAAFEDEIVQIEAKMKSGDLTDDEYERLADQKSKLITQINNKINNKASEYAGSLPYFNKDLINIRTSDFDYIFYRPVCYRQGSSRQYVHSVVIMKLSIESLVQAIRSEAINIIISAAIIAVVAFIVGLIGSMLFASFIIKPIKILEEFVDRFGRAKKKKNFNKTTILIKNKKNKKEKKDKKEKGEETILLKDDEVGRLGSAINNMKDQIIANEIEQNLLLDGSEVQNAFMPIEKGTSYAKYDDQNIEAFGYYLAQSGVSGDYFDYYKLEGDWYIFIKSDASGHGSPAAFIMTVVAIFFQEYVKNWSFKKNGTRINEVVYSINDYISKLGLRGKFATVIVSLLNTKTGDLYMCNAGDNLVNIYRDKTKKVETLTLNSCPTTGVFDSDMIRMGTGYIVEKNKLEKNDVLFLYTDGIEESTRRMRFPDFSVQVTETEQEVMNPETKKREKKIKTEEIKEEFGPDRVRSVIEAVFNKKLFELTKDQNPMVGEKLEFDFTKSDASLHDVIYALASAEKVFRLYKPAGLHSGIDNIQIDIKIDEYLSKYFNRYDFYSKRKEEDPDKPNFIIYEHMREDEQSDDLTMLAIKRK